MSKIRHVHARRGEYVRVHRNGSSSGDGWGILLFVGGIAMVILIINFIEVIMWTAAFAGLVYALVRFRKEVWKFICWSVKLVWTILTYIVKGIGYVIGKLMSLFKSSKPQPTAAPYGKDNPNYGKILQDYDWN